MKVIIAFFSLIRSVNLLFIALTQVLFQYCILIPLFHNWNVSPTLSGKLFILLVIASLLIAAGGYIINDYFDLNIDQINKPEKIVVEKFIKRRWAILWHLGLSAIGVIISFYVGWKINNLFLALANFSCVVLLWFYSTTFKKKLLLGNIIIALLSAWVVFVLYFCEWTHYFNTNRDSNHLHAMSRVYQVSFLYAGFAFVISLIREVVKDMEDIRGDLRYGCKTMPIVWGMNVSKVFVATWLIVLIAALVIVQFYVLQFRWWWAAVYCFTLIILPLLYIFRKLFIAQTPPDFHKISNHVKIVMLTGILSMIFFRLYT